MTELEFPIHFGRFIIGDGHIVRLFVGTDHKVRMLVPKEAIDDISVIVELSHEDAKAFGLKRE